MKYVIFGICLVLASTLVGYLFGLSVVDDPIIQGSYAAKGAGAALGGMVVGLLGLMYKQDRFKGFVVASVVMTLLGPFMPAIIGLNQ